jgi:Bifunctional DNA primase/polymerase, N-terminal
VVDTDPYLMRCALRLAGGGMVVFPLRPNTKVPALGRGWRARATRDQEQVRSWWSALPFNIGVATGDGLIVVDLDAPKVAGESHGRLNLIRLASEVGERVPRDTFTVVTGRGGQHLYFRVPADAGLRNTAGTLAPNVDSRAEGGYVVGPGSVVNGRRYRITNHAAPAPLPGWLLERLRPVRSPEPARRVSSAYVDAVLRGETEAVARAAVGTRNTTLFRAAARLGMFVAQYRLTETDVTAALEHACSGFDDFGPHEVRRTIRSGLDRAGRRGPYPDVPPRAGRHHGR